MQDAQVTVRLPAGVVARLDALTDAMKTAPRLSAVGRITRSAVARLALEAGLESLEAEYLTTSEK
jgi:predicted transcriptional regulator